MTSEELARRRDEFIASLAKKYRVDVGDLVNHLRTRVARYSPEKEGEIDAVAKAFAGTQTEKKRKASLKAIYDKVKIHDDPCWLRETPGVMCQGHIIPARYGKMPKPWPSCSQGGDDHYFAFRRSQVYEIDIPTYINQIKAIRERSENEIRLINARHRKAMKDPLPIPDAAAGTPLFDDNLSESD